MSKSKTPVTIRDRRRLADAALQEKVDRVVARAKARGERLPGPVKITKAKRT